MPSLTMSFAHLAVSLATTQVSIICIVRTIFLYVSWVYLKIRIFPFDLSTGYAELDNNRIMIENSPFLRMVTSIYTSPVIGVLSKVVDPLKHLATIDGLESNWGVIRFDMARRTLNWSHPSYWKNNSTWGKKRILFRSQRSHYSSLTRHHPTTRPIADVALLSTRRRPCCIGGKNFPRAKPTPDSFYRRYSENL